MASITISSIPKQCCFNTPSQSTIHLLEIRTQLLNLLCYFVWQWSVRCFQWNITKENTAWSPPELYQRESTGNLYVSSEQAFIQVNATKTIIGEMSQINSLCGATATWLKGLLCVKPIPCKMSAKLVNKFLFC